MPSWSLSSWKRFSYQQVADYPNSQELDAVVEQLSLLPPLVSSGEIKNLRKALTAAGRGQAFILQGGDCAESFQDSRSDIISNKLKIILQMSLILLHGLKKPIIKIGRIAGQYAKPRSQAFETINGISLPNYRGDLINSAQFDALLRQPEPQRMLKGYHSAAITLNFIRALLSGGFANLQQAQQWDLQFRQHSLQADTYHALVKDTHTIFEFLKAIDVQSPDLYKGDFYTSHEALNLHYEQALTRKCPDGRWYNLSTHFPWIGLRTAHPDSAHLEFIRGIENPIGIKIGPKTNPESLAQVIKIANPLAEEGKLILITRLGAKYIDEVLPPLIDTVRKTGIPVLWSSDPMHGNTEITNSGIKTRHFDNILSELRQALSIHRTMGTYLAGVHFELTGENVTECLGGAGGLEEKDLPHAYHSLLDPRLNYEQSLEMAIQISREFKV